jgi:hypothetical protein
MELWGDPAVTALIDSRGKLTNAQVGEKLQDRGLHGLSRPDLKLGTAEWLIGAKCDQRGEPFDEPPALLPEIAMAESVKAIAAIKCWPVGLTLMSS